LEYAATLLIETERTPATRITGYFENVVPNLSDGKLKKNRMRRNTFLADSCTRDYVQIIIMMQCGKPMLANMSADATHRFQPFQPSSELVEKVDQPNQPETVFFSQ